jgi:hypothetical protein
MFQIDFRIRDTIATDKNDYFATQTNNSCKNSKFSLKDKNKQKPIS